MKRGKKYKAAAALVDKEKLYTIEEAVALEMCIRDRPKLIIWNAWV